MCSFHYMHHKSLSDGRATSIADAEKNEQHPQIVINPREISKGQSEDF